MIKLTPTLRKRITSDWNSYFPEMAPYKPMWLLKRVGPLLIGICLDKSSDNELYRPTFHIHNLAIRSSVIKLSLYQQLRNVRNGAADHVLVKDHDGIWLESAIRFSKQIPVPLQGDVTSSDMIHYCREYVARPENKGCVDVYSDMISICSWCEQYNQANEIIDEAVKSIKGWPDYIRDNIEGGAENWYEETRDIIDDKNYINSIVAEEVQKHKLEKLPETELKCN